MESGSTLPPILHLGTGLEWIIAFLYRLTHHHP